MRLNKAIFQSVFMILAVVPSAIQSEETTKSSAAVVTKLQSVLEASSSVTELESVLKTPLTKVDAEKAAKLIWSKHSEKVKPEREAELKSGKLEIGDKAMPFTYKKFGEKPKNGHSLWISMHGGGGAPKAVNDRQWENQKRLYKLEEGIYLVPRAPTDTWDLWHQGHIDEMYTRLIEDMIIVEGVDPNRVYIMGYSAGGDGV